MEHLQMRKSYLVADTYYLQISWCDMKLKLTLGILFDRRSWPMILSPWSYDFFYKHILVCKLYTVLLPILLCLNFSSIVKVEVDISSKKLYTKKYSREKVIWPNSWLHPYTPFIKGSSQYKFSNDITPGNLYVVCISK